VVVVQNEIGFKIFVNIGVDLHIFVKTKELHADRTQQDKVE